MKISPDGVVGNQFGSGQRIPALDGVRGCAILLVLVWHYLQNQLRPEVGSTLAYFRQALGFTWSGVDLFFVLSGFLIAGILLDKRNSPNYFRAFYIRRVCRIFPLYYLNLLLFIFFIWLGLDNHPVMGQLAHEATVPLWSYFTFTQNIFMGLHNTAGYNWMAVTWSLAIEEQFYLVFPLLIRFVPLQRLPLLFLWFAVLAVYLRYVSPGLSAYINTPWRLDALMIGALLAWLVRVPGFLEGARKQYVWLLLLFGVMLAGTVIATIEGRLLLGGTLTHLSLAILYTLFILLALVNNNGMLSMVLGNRVLIWLGTISFGVYIFHTTISRIVHALVRGSQPYIVSWTDAGATLLALALTLLVSQLSFVWYESRITRIGHAVSYGEYGRDRY